MNKRVDASPEPAAALPRPLPGTYPGEPAELAAYRRDPGDEKAFIRLRRAFRDAEDWRALACLLVVHAAYMERDTDARGKAAELCVQAYELWMERVKDRKAAGYALARAVVLKPDHTRAVSRLRKLYEANGARKELVALLRFQLRHTDDPAKATALHIELAGMLREHCLAVGEAVDHYEEALKLSPGHSQATQTLVEIYLDAGAGQHAAAAIETELQQTETTENPERAAELHRRLAAIEAGPRENVPGAARHLQAALELQPDDVEALRTFGELYLGSANEGAGKAADIFYKAAEVARRGQRHGDAIKLLRRALSLAPEHAQAAISLEGTLVDAEDWLALDDLYREWLLYDQGAEAVPLMLRRADLLENRLHRREEARQLFEEASRHESPDGESWRRLENIYDATSDVYALASLLETRAERLPDDVPTDALLRTAKIYRDDLGNDERAAVFFYKVLDREPFNTEAFEGYKEHWRRKHNWSHLSDLLQFQIDQACAVEDEDGPLADPKFAEEFAERADICERRLGDIDGALETWRRMAEHYPREGRPAKEIARIEKRARMWDNMVRVQEAELARTVDPRKRLDILKRLTQVYRDRQVNRGRAIDLYREILELSPGDVQATRALTALHDRQGDYEEVSELLRAQYDRSRSPTEKSTLLRRLAEIWHHELDAHDEAIWACEAILERTPSDRESLVRLQQILAEQERYDDLLTALQRELDQTSNRDAKVKVLRRMARVAEHDLADQEQAAALWSELLAILPGNLDITDKVISLYEALGRYEELGTLLQQAANAKQTPDLRQVDYLLRLAHLAESSLDDLDTARACFERVLKGRPNHRGALEALVRLYRAAQSWSPLVTVLGRLQGLAETDDDAFRIAWERSEILSEQLADATAAIEVLEALGRTPSARGNQEVARTLLDLYGSADRHRDVVRQAELLLLATEDAEERHALYSLIANTWREPLDDPTSALATYGRLLDEFAEDTQSLDTMAELQVEVGDHEGALASLQRRRDLLTEPEQQVATLVQMSGIAQNEIGDGARALDLLRRALAVDHYALDVLAQARRVAKAHSLWRELLGLFDERFVHMSTAADVPAQLEVCFEASQVAEDRYRDAEKSFDWARRGFFVSVESGVASEQGEARLRELADAHHLWNELLKVIEEEIVVRTRRGEIERGTFDLAGRLNEAADLAIGRLDDPSRAVAYLQRAHHHDPDDEAIAQRLEKTARAHRLWDAVIEFHSGRLERNPDDHDRFDACGAIAKTYEDELDDPEKAFEWLRQGWLQLRNRDARLAQESLDGLLALSERHALWPQLAHHFLERATEAFGTRNLGVGLSQIQEAAQIFDRRLADPLGAMRVLSSHLAHDPGGTVLLPAIRRLGEQVDERRAGDVPPVGAMLHLAVLQRLLARARNDDETRRLLEERAEIREMRLDDPRGAMTEWLRVAYLDPEDDDALVELERLAEDGDAWDAFLVLPAWRLERAAGLPDLEASLLRRLAQLYEGPLERPEYALRARIEAWRREPTLPAAAEDLDDGHAAIWRLAEQTGAYHTPPVPRDPLMRPTIDPPELADLRVWVGAGLDPNSLIDTAPSPFAAKLDVSSPQAILRTVTEEVSLPLPASASPTPVASSGTMEIEVVEVIEDVELLELSEAAENAEATVTVSSAAVRTASPHGDAATRTSTAPKAPPPPPRPPDAGLPTFPRLSSNVLPTRPRVANAWEEVATAYGSTPTRDRAAKAAVALCLARLWEHGAGNLERAFQAHEQALITLPEDPSSLTSLQSLAERHNVLDRLLVAYQRLLAEATLPRHIIAQNLRIAELQEGRDDLDAAEQCYRAVQSVAPRHVEALTKLLHIYATRSEPKRHAEVLAELIEACRETWSVEELVKRSLELAQMLHTRLDRTKDAVEHLELLVRQCPDQADAHAALIELLVDIKRWQPAIEAMRTAWGALDDDEFRFRHILLATEIYEQHLGLPDRALATVQEIVDTPEAELPPETLDAALAIQQRLFEATSRSEALVEVIERRASRLDPDDEEAEIALRIDEARVLHRGLGDDDRALSTLETLHGRFGDRDEVVQALAEQYRHSGRYEDGVELSRRHWRSLPPSEPRARAVAVRLADVMAEHGDARSALGVVEAVLEHHGEDPDLRDRRVTLARSLHDLEALANALTARGTPDDQLEAAGIVDRQLGDGARAMRLYSRVLGDAKRHADDPEAVHRFATALDGLVGLRVADGDIDGAMAFMDKQLSEVEGAAIRAPLLTEMGRITFESTGDMAAARQRFDAALAEDPEHAGAQLGLAQILVQAGELGDAEELLTAAVEALALGERQGDLVAALVLLAEVLERTDRSAEAYRRLTAALRHDGDNLEIRAAVVRNRHRANRHRDAVTAAEQIEQRLADHPPSPRQRRMASDTFVLAALSEQAQKNSEGAYQRYRRAAQLDPNNVAALDPLVALCQEHGDWVEAAVAALGVARNTEDRETQVPRFVEASLLYFDAAAAVEDSHDDDLPAQPAALRQSALEAVTSALDLAEGHLTPLVERGAWEAVFRHTHIRDEAVALRVLGRLFHHEDIPTERHHDLLLEGVHLALAAPDQLELAERYAFKARQIVPESSAAVLAHAEVFQATNREEEIEPLVETFFKTRRDHGNHDQERRNRITLLLRLAELHSAHPEKAAASLERAAALSPDALGAAQRRRLAEIYSELDRFDATALDNHRRLLEHEPLFVPSLSALAHYDAEAGQIDHAHGIYGVLALIEPEHETAGEFLGAHTVEHDPPDGPMPTEWADAMQPPYAPDGGVGEALVQLWEHGHALLGEHLPKLEVPPDARVSPLAEGLLAETWADFLKRLGQHRVALVDAAALTDDHEQERPDAARDGGYFHVRCQNPPMILAEQRAWACTDPAELRFALGRAIYFTRPDAVFATGLRRSTLAMLLSATLGAFHPRHTSRRRHHAKGTDEVSRLTQEFARKLPMKVSRTLGALFRTHEGETFDSPSWRAWVRRCGNRVGLVLCGDLRAALRVMNDGDPEPSGEPLRQWAEDDADVRDLLTFAASSQYAEARRALGMTVVPLAAPEEPEPDADAPTDE